MEMKDLNRGAIIRPKRDLSQWYRVTDVFNVGKADFVALRLYDDVSHMIKLEKVLRDYIADDDECFDDEELPF